MNNPELHFEEPLLLLLIIPALAVVLIPWLRIPKQRRAGFRKKATAALHCVISCLLAVIIAGASLTLPVEAQPETEPDPEETQETQRVLVLTDDAKDAESLIRLLPDGIEADVLSFGEAPVSSAELGSYAKIILLNGTLDALPSAFPGLLAQYVTNGGCVLLSGGQNTFSSFAGTAVETVSPVTFDYSRSDSQGTALMLVLDCSSSMSGQNGNNRGGKNSRYGWNSGTTTEDTSGNLALAKQGAIRSIESLTSSDSVGIVSFNSSAVLQAELSPATDAQKAVLSRIISGLNTSQGTYYCDALSLAWEQLQKSDAETRHVIFLSDGEPSDWGYDSLVQQIAEEGITVSTIALGYSSDVLEQMAAEGGGRYYAVTSVNDLPDIMLSETEQTTADPLLEEAADVYLAGGIPSGLPAISGYIGTTLKDQAVIKLQTAEGDPVWASVSIGDGQAEVFTSDLTGSWTSSWQEDADSLIWLQQIVNAGLTSNEASQEAAEAVGTAEDQAIQTIDLLLPLGIILLLLILADISIRRLRWKDVAMLFRRQTAV